MTDDAGTADRVRRFFAEHEQVPEPAVTTAKDLFGLRTVEDELIELSTAGSIRDDDATDDVMRFVFHDLTVLVQRDATGSRVLVAPADTEVLVETAEGSSRLELDEHGEALLPDVGLVRFRVRLPDGTTGVTDGFDPSAGR